MTAKKIIALVLIVIFIALGISSSGSLALFIDIGSMLIVLGITLGMALIALRFSEIFASLFGSTHYLNRTTVFFLGNTFFLAGAIGTLIGVVLMLAHLDDPAALGPGLAVALLTLIYGFTLKFIIDSFGRTSLPVPTSISDSAEKVGISPSMAVLGVILFIVFISFGILTGGSITLFIDIGTILICVGGGLAALFVSNSLQDIKNALKGGFGGIYTSVEEARNAVRITSNMYNRFFAFGFIGVIIGLLIMFVNMDNPASLGPGMAIVILSFLYAICLGMIVLAFGTAARRQVNWAGEDEKPELFVSPVSIGLFTIAFTIAAFVLLLKSFSEQ